MAGSGTVALVAGVMEMGGVWTVVIIGSFRGVTRRVVSANGQQKSPTEGGFGLALAGVVYLVVRQSAGRNLPYAYGSGRLA